MHASFHSCYNQNAARLPRNNMRMWCTVNVQILITRCLAFERGVYPLPRSLKLPSRVQNRTIKAPTSDEQKNRARAFAGADKWQRNSPIQPTCSAHSRLFQIETRRSFHDYDCRRSALPVSQRVQFQFQPVSHSHTICQRLWFPANVLFHFSNFVQRRKSDSRLQILRGLSFIICLRWGRHEHPPSHIWPIHSVR